MASTDDLSAQLSISTKLAAVIERMAASADQLEKSYETQIDAVQKLSQAMGQVNVQGVVQNVEVLNKALRDMRSNMNDAGKASESSFQKLGKKATEAGKEFKDRFPKSVAVGAAALSGFEQGVRNVIALTKGVGRFFTSFTGGLFDVAAAIVAIPFKIFTGLIDLAEKSTGGMNELAQAIENMRKEFGALGSVTPKTITDMSKGLQGFGDTGLSAWRVFGNLAQRIEAFTKLAAEMGATFTSLWKEFDDNGGALLAYQKGLGISDEQMKGVAQRALSMGDTIADTFKDTTKYSLELAKAFGLDAKVISRDMVKAFGDVKHFAGATVKEVGEAATYARKLGVELDKITGTLDAFETFDTAAENVAKLSQSFGVTVDAFQLMQAQDPAEQIDILRKSFATAGVDASNFNRQQLKLLASTTGLDEATAKQAFSMKNQGVSLDQVKKKGGEAEKKTLTQAEAMGKLADAIERMVQSGGGLSGGFFDNFFKGILGGIQSTKEFYGLMFNIQKALYQVQMIGVKLGRVLPDLIPGFKDMLGGLKAFFDPKTFSKLFEGISQSVKEFFSTDEKYASEKGNIPALVKNLHKNIEDFFTMEGPHGKRILDGFKRFFTFMSGLAADGIRWASDRVAEGIRGLVGIIQHPERLAKAGQAGKEGVGFVASALGPIVDALRHAGKVIFPALVELTVTLGHKLHDLLTSPQFIKLIRPALPYLAAALFGPAFSRAILGAVTTSVVKGAVGMLTGGGGRSLVKKAIVSMSSKLEGGLLGKAAGVAGKLAGPAAIVSAGLSIGAGVEEYTDKITSTLDHSTKVIAAGATGLIDALTLGLLPKDLSTMIANTLATVVDMIYSGISSVFGKGFADSLRRQLSSAFEVLGNVWSVLKNLFTGDQGSFNQSVIELGLSILRFVVSSLEYMLIQLPALIVKLSVEVLNAVSGIIIRVVGAAIGLIASGVDGIFGTSFASKVNAWTDTVRGGLSTLTDKVVKTTDDSSKAVSDATQRFNDTYLRSAADKAKIAASSAASVAQATNVEVAKAADGTGEGIAKVAENLQAIKEAKKQLDDKDFDVAGAVQSISDRLKGVSFDIISSDQVADMTRAADNFHVLDRFVSGAQGSFSAFADLGKAAQAIKKGAMAEAAMAVSEMVKVANDLDKALADGNINRIDVKAKLERVARAVGLGGKATYTVNPSKQVQITVNLEVSMDVDKVERVMIMRQKSIIRDRLNFATESPGQQGTNTIPSEYQQTLPDVGGGTQ